MVRGPRGKVPYLNGSRWLRDDTDAHKETYEKLCTRLLRAVVELPEEEQKEFFENWKRVSDHPSLSNREFILGLIPVLEKSLAKKPFPLLDASREALTGEHGMRIHDKTGWLWVRDGYCLRCNLLNRVTTAHFAAGTPLCKCQ